MEDTDPIRTARSNEIDKVWTNKNYVCSNWRREWCCG